MARPVNPEATLARRLRQARERLGLSQRELGLLVGFAPNVAAPKINQYERGSAAPLAEDLQRLAEALGLPAAALVTEDPVLHRMLVAWADAPVRARTAAVRQLEAQAAEAEHPGQARVTRRIEQTRRQWAADREAELKARAKARAKTRKKATTAAPAAKRASKTTLPGRRRSR